MHNGVQKLPARETPYPQIVENYPSSQPLAQGSDTTTRLPHFTTLFLSKTGHYVHILGTPCLATRGTFFSLSDHLFSLVELPKFPMYLHSAAQVDKSWIQNNIGIKIVV